MESEQIPVTVGISYSITAVASFLSSWASGATITLVFYQSTGTQISSVTATQSNMTGGVNYTWSTAATLAPANSAYAIAFIQASGTPAAANTLAAFQCQVTDQNGVYVNVNYSFAYTTYPWSPTNVTNTVTWQYNPVLDGDSDSLVLGESIEIMGGTAGVPSVVPALLDSNGVGPTFRLLAPPSLNSSAFGYESSYDLSAPQPTQDVVASMLLDGERPFGYRASNRTMSLPIIIFGTRAGGMTQVLAAREYLMSVIDQQYWQITWTSADSGLSMLFDCFRALPTAISYDINHSAGGTASGQSTGRPNFPIAMVTLVIQALPYGRSEVDGIQNLAFSTPLINGPVAAGAVNLDFFGTNGQVRQIGSAIGTATTTFNVPVTAPAPKNDGVVVAVTAPNATAQTITCTDSDNNPYTLTKTVQNATATATSLWVFTSPNIRNSISPGDFLTITTTNSQNMAATVLGVAGMQTVDAAATATATGHSTTPAVTSSNGQLSSNAIIALFANSNTQAAVNPVGYSGLGNVANGAAEVNGSWKIANGTNSDTATSSFGSSSSWAACSLVCNIAPGYTWNGTSQHYLSGTTSMYYAPPVPMHRPWPNAVYSATLPAPTSIVGLTSLAVWFGQAYDTQWPHDPKFRSNVTLSYQLTDVNGRKLTFHKTQDKCTYGTHPTVPKWTRISAAIPQGDRLFSYNSVVSYVVTVSNWHGSGHSGYVRMHCWLDGLTANPQTIANPTSPRGTVYNLFGLPGSARSPISVQCQLPAAQNIVKEITTPATGKWITPAGVYSVQAEAWAGGGAGASALSYDGTVALYNPLGWWKLGANANDSAAAPHNGTATSVTFNQTNSAVVGNNSASFNGSTSQIAVPYQLSGLKQMTVSGWVNPQGLTQSAVTAIVGNSIPSSDNRGFLIYLANTTGPFSIGAEVGNGSTYGLAAVNNTIPATGWTHVAFTWDAVTIRLYINGAQVATAALTGSMGLGTGNKIGIGYDVGAAGQVFNGLIQEVSILPTVLNANQMLQLANSGAAIGGGGGGGEYAAESLLNVMPGIAVPWSIGAGGQPAQLANTVVQFTRDGLSHWTCPPNVTQVLAEVWGAGAAGAAGGGGGGGGGYSQILQTVTPGTTYNLWCGKAGKPDTGKTSADKEARAGQNSWFGPPNTHYASTAYVAAIGGLSGITGGTGGGYGGTTTGAIGSIKWPGGRGGHAPGAGGGGGGGAAGMTGPGGPGGDSPAFSFGGRWTGSGAGGTGSGQGGDGGAGSSAPGFPGAGEAPGGGGGGGYDAAPIIQQTVVSLATSSVGQVNYLGGYGGNGLVQLTYAVNQNAPTNGGNTIFGSTGTTGTVVTAHGGTSVLGNISVGAAGGSGSSNTLHNSGGKGALDLTTGQGSWMNSPNFTNTNMQALANTAYTTGSGTTGTSASSCALGAALVLIESTTSVSDLIVTDSAGNTYAQVASAQAGASGTGATVYGFTASIEYPITTSTTLTVTSATGQQYGVLWYASPYMLAGASTSNLNANNGNGTTASGQFGVADTSSVVYEIAVALNDAPSSYTVSNAGITWYNLGSTNTLTAGSMRMDAFVMLNQAGGTLATGSGDVFSATLSSANWAVLCIPMLAANQTDVMVTMDWKAGTTPGATTAWTNLASISAAGMILVVGQAGSGSSITSGPSAISDASGNVYTVQNTTVLPSNMGTMFVATAPVTHALAAGTTGSISWGTASAAPEYAVYMWWLPSVTGLDANGVSAVTGTAATAASGSYTPRSAGDMAVSFVAVSTTASEAFANQSAPWNSMNKGGQAYLQSAIYAAQMTDNFPITNSPTWNNSAPFGLLTMGFTNALVGGGGGAAGGDKGPGYPATTWQFGGPAYGGGGHGGTGASNANSPGGHASLPGGGGAGAVSTSTSVEGGGVGGGGMLRLTWSPPLKTFNSLIVHRPGLNADPMLSPLCPIPITDAPNGTEYTMPSLVPQVNATFNSTYTVILANHHWDSPNATSSRHITVTINQYEYPGGPRTSVQMTRSITPAIDVVNGLIGMGEVTLPIKDYIAYNDQAYFTISINDTDQNDRFMDVLFLDTTGQTVLINIDPGQAGYGEYVNYFIDEATPDRDLGFVGASFQNRQHQTSVLDYTMISGGALYITPGDNLLLTYSPDGAPNIGVRYAPRWNLDRTS